MLPGLEGKPWDVVSLDEPVYQGLEIYVVSPESVSDQGPFGARHSLRGDGNETYIFILQKQFTEINGENCI